MAKKRKKSLDKITPEELGDEVVLIGKQKEECLKAEELAGILGTIPYDIFCSISARVPHLLLNHQGDSHE